MTNLNLDKVLTQIAQKHFPSVETLEVRNSDSLDFHDVYVGSIKDALEHAFSAGAKEFQAFMVAKC